MTKIKLIIKKDYKNKQFITMEIRPEYSKSVGQQLFKWGYKYSRVNRIFYKNYEIAIENKKLIKENIDFCIKNAKFYSIEQYQMTKIKTNLSDDLFQLGIEHDV